MSTTVQTPARAARMAHPARAAQLLDVVEKLALTEGLASVTMQRIADLAGVAKPVIYRHFANASEALLVVLERRWAEIDADLDAIFSGGPNFEAEVAQRVEHYLIAMASDRYRIRKLLAVADGDPVVFQAWRKRLDRRTRDLAAILAETHDVAPGAAQTLATFCIGALSRLGDKIADAPEPAAAQARRFARFIAGGLASARQDPA
ncbi:TetR/AcrR family transcriptional regulator [Phenylobacterium sp.]|jgi:AcrR family transcriptional regulator|uniref:TetR/AcrR family transcriptional regulator n=1 Tax=Phenylobacterium sp. TaxID=1871053 RepID=UPI002E324739|nr:TetR/AcrR family transcriptional regulator [Phenylobacterium sp.]HEX3367496.1 TetR/AcrR family transcriptional regulator [Phenylobacterium sp.]